MLRCRGPGFLTSQWVVWIGRPVRSLANNRVKRNWVITTSNNNNSNKTPTKQNQAHSQRNLVEFQETPLVYWSFFSWVAGKPQTARWVGRLHCQVSTIALWGRSMGAATALLWLGRVSEKQLSPWIVHYRHINNLHTYIYIYLKTDVLFMRFPHW